MHSEKLNTTSWIYKITKKKMLIKSKTFCIEFLAVSILLGLFSWLGGRAVNRYISQPLSTDIGTTFGDNGIGIRFPLITFCAKVEND